MNEVDEALLNEYVDGALDEAGRQRVEKLLANSAEAAAYLAELQALLADFDEVVEVPLQTDVSAGVLREIQQASVAATPRWLRLLPLLQLVGVGLLLVVLWTTLEGWLQRSRSAFNEMLMTVQMPQLTLVDDFRVWGTAVWENAQFSLPLPDLATSQWLLLLTLAFILWLAGNQLLFTNNDGGFHE